MSKCGRWISTQQKTVSPTCNFKRKRASAEVTGIVGSIFGTSRDVIDANLARLVYGYGLCGSVHAEQALLEDTREAVLRLKTTRTPCLGLLADWRSLEELLA